jgi:low temperature requirement protein LtrA
MRGRDPHQPHRVATPLELLFDLTFVIAYGTAASELAHFLAAGHIGPGIGGFAFASFGIALFIHVMFIVPTSRQHRVDIASTSPSGSVIAR